MSLNHHTRAAILKLANDPSLGATLCTSCSCTWPCRFLCSLFEGDQAVWCAAQAGICTPFSTPPISAPVTCLAQRVTSWSRHVLPVAQSMCVMVLLEAPCVSWLCKRLHMFRRCIVLQELSTASFAKGHSLWGCGSALIPHT